MRPDPWDAAEAKAAKDVALITQSEGDTVRISWLLSQNPALVHLALWGQGGTVIYPPQTEMTPFPYQISQDTLNRLRRIQKVSSSPHWRTHDGTTDTLLFCQSAPDLCLIYDRTALVAALGLDANDLAGRPSAYQVALLLAGFGGLLGGLAAWVKHRANRQITIDTADTFQLLPERHVAMRGRLEVPLTPRDLKLLSLLAERSGDVVTKDELYDRAWGRDYMPNSRALDQHMITLRLKLDPDKTLPVLIETVRGVGYRLRQ